MITYIDSKFVIWRYRNFFRYHKICKETIGYTEYIVQCGKYLKPAIINSIYWLIGVANTKCCIVIVLPIQWFSMNTSFISNLSQWYIVRYVKVNLRQMCYIPNLENLNSRILRLLHVCSVKVRRLMPPTCVLNFSPY